jgi:hypothetical protein
MVSALRQGGLRLKTNSMKIKFLFSFFMACTIWTLIIDPGTRFFPPESRTPAPINFCYKLLVETISEISRCCFVREHERDISQPLLCVFTTTRAILAPHLTRNIPQSFLEESMVIPFFHFLELFGKFTPICYNTMVNQLEDGGLHE